MCCNSCCSGCGCGCGCSDDWWSCGCSGSGSCGGCGSGSGSCGCGGGGASTLPSYPDLSSGRSYPIWLSVPAFISRRGVRAATSADRTAQTALDYGF